MVSDPLHGFFNALVLRSKIRHHCNIILKVRFIMEDFLKEGNFETNPSVSPVEGYSHAHNEVLCKDRLSGR